ncbi:MAG: protein kinase [Blastocatellia bacterium]|nr:protein kinase [Blastocatellia bacterium]
MLEPDTLLQSRYRIHSQIGHGGMGMVYLARDENLGISVAVKQNILDDTRLIEAFKREARLLAGLRHPALPQVKDHFILDGTGQFLVMEYIAGDNLETILEKRKHNIAPAGEAKPFEVDEVIRWAEQLLDVLDYLHTRPEPVIHRDIKPQNLKLAERNQIILLDFGLAKGKPIYMTRVTTTGSIHGYTPNYAPIEQIRGVGTDPRSDLYALGATLYHLLTGLPPTDAATRADAYLGDEADPLLPAYEANPKMPRAISNVLAKAMEQHRNNRIQSAREMLEMLRAAKRSTAGSQAREEEARKQAEAEIVLAESKRREEARKAREEIERRRAQEEQQRKVREEAERRQREEQRAQERESVRQKQAAPEAIAPARPGRGANKKWLIIGGIGLVAIGMVLVSLFVIFKDKGTQPSGSGEESKEPARLKPGVFRTSGAVYRVSLSDNGRLLASVSRDGAVRLWLPEGERPLGDPSHRGRSVAVSRDGQLVASGSEDGKVRVWRASDGKPISAFEAHSDYVFSVGFSPDGQTLYSAGGEKKIKFWRVSDGSPLKTIETPEEGYLIVTVSPDMQLAGFYNPDGAFKLWSIEQDDLVRLLEGDVPAVSCGAFTRYAWMLALGSRDGEVQLWRVDNGRMIRSLGSFGQPVWSVAFSEDGKIVAASFNDGLIRVWSTSDGQLIKTLEGHTRSVDTLSFGADGRLLASGSEDGTVRLWEIPEQ